MCIFVSGESEKVFRWGGLSGTGELICNRRLLRGAAETSADSRLSKFSDLIECHLYLS